jgi:type IV secretory pathway VirB2 component (pilin)
MQILNSGSGIRSARLIARKSYGHGRALVAIAFSLVAIPAYAQGTGDPWDNAVQVLQTAFTSTIARGLSLVAIVVGGLMFAFGEGQSKRTLAGIIFGVGMSIGAVNFMAWLFP